MNPTDLAAIKERLSKTTPGPWHYDGMHYEITAPHGNVRLGDRYWIIASECRSRPDGPLECDAFGHCFDPDYDFLAHAREDIPALIAALEEQEQVRTCIWTHVTGDDCDYWETECGTAHVFTVDGPAENGYKCCPYCGGKLKIEEPARDGSAATTAF